MENVSLKTELFKGGKVNIKIDPGTHTGLTLSMGTCSLNPKGNAKCSRAAIFLDKLFIDGQINALEAVNSDSVYVQISSADGINHGIVTKGNIQWETMPTDNLPNIIALCAFALSSHAKCTEYKDSFEAIKKSYYTNSANAAAGLGEVMLFCDSLYYEGLLQDITELCDVTVEEYPVYETAKQAWTAQELVPIKAFDGLKNLPTLEISKAKSRKKASAAKTSINFDDCKAGKYILNYKWDDEENIVPLSFLDDFVPCEQYFSLVKKLDKRLNNILTNIDAGMEGIEALKRDFVNALMIGKPGTGKTTIAYALSATFGIPVYSVTLSKNTEEDEFQCKTVVVNGQLQSVETFYSKAFENGGIIMLEEVNLPDAGVLMGAIGQGIEFPFILMKQGYIPVKRHPLCVVLGAFNVGTEGSRSISQALSSRFKQTYQLNDPTKDEFIERLKKRNSDELLCTWIYNIYSKLIAYLESPNVNAPEIALNVTMRGCYGALENIEEGEDAKTAITNTLIGKIAEIDLELAKQAKKAVVDTASNF